MHPQHACSCIHSMHAHARARAAGPSIMGSIPAAAPLDIWGSAASSHTACTSTTTPPNGFTPNGISNNGITPNGISHNGISTNGITANGIANGIIANGTGSGAVSPDVAGPALPAFRIVVANEYGNPSSSLPSSALFGSGGDDSRDASPQFFKMELADGAPASALFDVDAMTQPQRHASCDALNVDRQHTLDECIQVCSYCVDSASSIVTVFH